MDYTSLIFFLLLSHCYAITNDQLSLLAIKSHFTFDSSHNTLARNWTSSISICGTRHRRMVGLDVSFMALTGRIAPEIGNLSFLASLNVAGNSLAGDLPENLGGLRRLRVVDMSSNNFSGEIPKSWFGSMTRLQELYLYNNSLTVLIVVVILSVKSILKSGKHLPPGSYGWPILGETREFLGAGLDGSPDNFIRERMEKYKCDHVFKTSIMGEAMAVLCSPGGNKLLFSNENRAVRVWWPSSVRKLLGRCLVTCSGDEGKQMRKMVSFFVSPDAFTRWYIKTMDMVSQQHIRTHWQGKDEVKVFRMIKIYTFQLACRLFMSLEDEEEISKLAVQFDIFLKGIISIPFDFPGTRFYNAKKATSAIKKQLLKIVRQRGVALEHKTAAPSQDLLSHLLVTPDENGKFMTESLIVNNILMLLFAAHDTSSVAITMLIKNLAQFPHVYQKVLQEQNEIASRKEKGEYLQWEDIQKMRYSWNVVCETLRLTPPIIGSFREALTDISYAGYVIPKGWKLYWSSAFTHRDGRFHDNYMDFDPCRFEEARGAGAVPFSYVPFGGGPRMCLGKEFARLETLIFLHNIVTRFRWNVVNEDEMVTYDPMPTPLHGLPIKLSSH